MTIASGFDIGARSKLGLLAQGLSQKIIDKLIPYLVEAVCFFAKIHCQ
ncbi:hypothetical protein H8F10_17160 [Vibrio fluvialis]|nr:hypothetical protein [Vibrio fluvialis]